MTALFLGIDAGGSHTHAVLGDATLRVLARAEGPASAMRPGGELISATIIHQTAARAASVARVTLPVTAVVVGAAGAGRPLEQIALAGALENAGVARRARVLADGEVALYAAFGDTPGIMVNAGTGSIAYARDPSGALHRSGGYGWQMADEGGGYWVGRQGLAAAAREHDGRGRASTIASRMLAALELTGFDALVRWAATATPAQVAGLAPHVLNAAREGEPVALDCVRDAARELADLVITLAVHFPGTAAIPVATTGRLLTPGSPLNDAVRMAIATALPRVRFESVAVDPPLGALRMAAALG